jgi:hypothetical protein
MANCAGIPWTSVVRRQGGDIERGSFIISHEEANGHFVGIFQEEGGPMEEIEGDCSVIGMTFVRPRSAPAFRYTGTFLFVGPIQFVRGSRVQISFPLEDAREAFADSASASDDTLSKEAADKLAARTFIGNLNLLPDDWTGERT